MCMWTVCSSHMKCCLNLKAEALLHSQVADENASMDAKPSEEGEKSSHITTNIVDYFYH